MLSSNPTSDCSYSDDETMNCKSRDQALKLDLPVEIPHTAAYRLKTKNFP